MADEQDRLRRRVERVLEPLLARDVEVVVGLVEEQDLGVRAKQQLEGEPLLLAPRQRRQRAVGGLGERLACGDRRARVPEDLCVPAARVAPRRMRPRERHAAGVAGLAFAAQLGSASLVRRAAGAGDSESSRSRTVVVSSRVPTSCRITSRGPSTRMLPSSTGMSPAIALKSVDFPAPFAPTSAACSPLPTRNETSRMSTSPPGMRQLMPLTSSAPTRSSEHMRAVVQRVVRARVTVDGDEVGAIGAGLCVLVGVTHDDDVDCARKLAAKVWNLRVFDDDEGVMNRSIAEAGGEVLVVSQFTLYGETAKGRRPSWIDAARPEHAEPLVDAVVAALRDLGARVATGRFGADMQVELVNDGPVTLLLEIWLTGWSRRGPPERVRSRSQAVARPASASATPGGSPKRTYQVSPSRSSTVPWTTSASLTAVRSSTSPVSDTIAVNPVGAICTTQRPVSIARMRLAATCWLCTIVPLNDAPLVGFATSVAPRCTPSRTRSPKNTSQLIAVATLPTPGTSMTAGPSPTIASLDTSESPATVSRIDRSGTNSPNGTRCTFS